MRSPKSRGGVHAAVIRLAAPALIAALLAGCSWFGGQGAGPNPREGEVRLGEFYFEPDEIQVRRGQQVTLRLRNVGSTIHNFRIEEFGVDQDVEVGRDETVTFTPDKAGTFRIVCDIPGHVEAGMVGSLKVNP